MVSVFGRESRTSLTNIMTSTLDLRMQVVSSVTRAQVDSGSLSQWNQIISSTSPLDLRPVNWIKFRWG